ncbi:MAG: hypothetical protein JRE40_04660 [Deltaproteobacteria bacterium]|nr:hypothetical protein [Deltaproteobacteria bacterium]
MKCNNYDKIVWSKQYRRLKRLPGKRIVGFDTETSEGKAYLMADSVNNVRWVKSFDDCLDFLTRFRRRHELNFFWNIDYDLFAVLKFLGRSERRQLWELGWLGDNRCRLKWIPHKKFSIRVNNNSFCFYDLYQYFAMSLDRAAERYLGKRKLEMDPERLNDRRWVREHWRLVEAYCRRDASLTAELGYYLRSLMGAKDIDFSKPVSPANVAQRYFLQHNRIPAFRRNDVQRWAFASYAGGRFEVFKRGHFPDLYVYDINAAYPYEISRLLDITRGTWAYSRRVPDNAEYGFIRVGVSVSDDYVDPLPVNFKGVRVFPDLRDDERIITLDELQFIRDHYDVDLKIRGGIFFFPSERVELFPNLGELYRERERLKAEGNDLYWVLKIIMNSLYGKFIELRRSYHRVGDPHEADYLYVGKDGVPVPCKTVFKSGNLFCPVYASIITSRVRLRLLEKFLEHSGTPRCGIYGLSPARRQDGGRRRWLRGMEFKESWRGPGDRQRGLYDSKRRPHRHAVQGF